MTDSTKNNYKVVCDDLSLVLFVKGFTLEEERDLYLKIRKKIEKASSPVSVEEYKQFIVTQFLEESKAFIDSLPNDVDESLEILDSAYDSIVGVYPPFSLEFICNDLNADTFFQGMDSSVLRHLQSQLPEEVPPKIPIQLSSIEDIQALEDYLDRNIVGQQPSIDALIRSLKLLASGLSKHSAFLFVGPTGVGKSQLGKLLGEKYSGNFYKINCAEYANAHEYAKLIGAPPGYIGHSEKSLLGEKAEQSSRWVFLFDEIEKAHHKLYDFLLSLLDDGTCTDNLGNILDFTESIFIFTSNQGVSEIKRDMMGFGREDKPVPKNVTKEIIEASLKNQFSPEFLNRLDDLIYFNPLTKGDVKEIARLQLELLPLQITDPLLDFIVENGYSDEYGARNIARFIKNNISVKVADAILNKRVPKGGPESLYKPRIVEGEVKIVGTKKYQSSSL